MRLLFTTLTCAAAIAVLTAQNAPAPPPAPAPQGQSEINFAIVGDNGAPLHYAVPDFVALTPDAETAAAARLMAEVLFNDLVFEREFDLIPRDTYRTIPVAQTASVRVRGRRVEVQTGRCDLCPRIARHHRHLRRANIP